MPAASDTIRFIEVEGSAAERGAALGRELRDETQAFFAAWRADTAVRVGADPGEFARRFVAGTGFVGAIRTCTPDLLDEVLAMADAAGIDHDEALAAQLVDETWLVGAGFGRDAKGEAPEHCSTIGRWAPGDAVIGQNMDLETFRAGFQLAVRHRRPDGPDLLLLASPGVIAFNGLNEHGVGVCVNALGELGGAPAGLPVAFMIRGVLEHGTAGDAATFVEGTPHASGQHYLVGGPDGLHALECGPGRADRLDVGPVVLHTNHALAAGAPPPAAPTDDELVSELAHSTHARLDSLRADQARGASLQDAFRAKRHPVHPVCRAVGEGAHFTFASTVMDLTDGPRLHVSAGPPDDHPYATFDFA